MYITGSIIQRFYVLRNAHTPKLCLALMGAGAFGLLTHIRAKNAFLEVREDGVVAAPVYGQVFSAGFDQLETPIIVRSLVILRSIYGTKGHFLLPDVQTAMEICDVIRDASEKFKGAE